MSDETLENRLAQVERVLANVTTEHTGQLLALQAIAAVATVRLMAGSGNPEAFIAECRRWAHSVVASTTAAATLEAETAEKMRQVARERVDGFFDGIKVRTPDG